MIDNPIARIALFVSAGLIVVIVAIWGLFSGSEPSRPKGAVVVELDSSSESGGATHSVTEAEQLPPSAAEHGGEGESTRAEAVETAWLDTPDPDLIEDSPKGPLPKIAEDGRMPWITYAKPFDVRDDRPRIAVVVTGLGLSDATTRMAIERLPSAVTLAFDPYARNIAFGARQARADGHEIILELPMEAKDFPFNDAGPAALLTSLTVEENIERLEAILGRTFGYVGVVTAGDSLLEVRETSLRPILSTVGRRGLMFVAGAPKENSVVHNLAGEIGVPSAVANIVLDEEPSIEAIDDALARLEAIAKDHAVAVGIAQAYPVSVDRLSVWASGLAERNVVLAPISALANRQLFP